jgi:SAM-dependent methyltransferase
MTLSARSRRRSTADKRSSRRSIAAESDRHELYESAVQDPAADADTLGRFYRRFRKRDAMTLREDFCGTAALSTAWVQTRRGRKAIGVDLDLPTMHWGRKRHIEPAGPDVERRVRLHHANVLDGVGGRTDIGCALNFSYSVFKRRADLLAYFRVARRKLAVDGVFILDVLGGWESMHEELMERGYPGFTYQWEQARFCALSHEILCYIHFQFPDGSSIPRAFTYDWRLWTAPELRDLLLEAGFSKVHLLWERTDTDGEGTGAYYEPRIVENQESWWTYIVAER